MSYEHVIWERDGGVGRVTLNRPDSLNAWTHDFGRELKQVIVRDAADPAVRAVLITGSGRGFSSGADLKSGFDPAPDDGMPDIRKELHELYHPIIAGVRRLETGSEPHAVPRPGRSARPGGGAAAHARPHEGLPGGRARLRGEAGTRVRRRLTAA